MRRSLFALAALLALGAAAPPPSDSIAFSISSWGKPLSAWRIDSAGAATRTYSEGSDFRDYRLITRRFDAGAKGFARIRSLLAVAERAARRGAPACGPRATDQPYGKADWSIGGKPYAIVVDLGCQNQALGPIHQALADADKQMEAWSAQGEIIEDREVKS